MHVVAGSWPKTWWERTTGLHVVAATYAIYFDAGVGTPPYLYINAGLRFDGASVPNVLWSVLAATPALLFLMGMIHDYTVRSDAVYYPEVGRGAPVPFETSIDMAVAVADWCNVSRLDQHKIRWGLTVSASSYWRKKSTLWEGYDQ